MFLGGTRPRLLKTVAQLADRSQGGFYRYDRLRLAAMNVIGFLIVG